MNEGGLVNHPMRQFAIVDFAGEREFIDAHTATVDNGVLLLIVVKSGMPYIVRGLAAGTWKSYYGSLPSDREVFEAQQEALRVVAARDAFEHVTARSDGRKD